jgi:hypothetical protein
MERTAHSGLTEDDAGAGLTTVPLTASADRVDSTCNAIARDKLADIVHTPRVGRGKRAGTRIDVGLTV